MGNVSTATTGPLLPPVSIGPVPEAPPVEPASPAMEGDSAVLATSTPAVADMGPLPWEQAAPTTPDEALAQSLDHLKASETFAQLEPDQQQVVLDTMTTMAASGSIEQIQKAGADLLQLLDEGKLTAQDAMGRTTLEHLAAFNSASLQYNKSPKAKADVARQVVAAIAHPGAITQRQGAQDCAETTLQATLAFSHPADYVRIATQLATRGKADIPGASGRPTTLEVPYFFGSFGSVQDQMNMAFLNHLNRYSYFSGGDGGYDYSQALNSADVKCLYDGVIGRDHVTIVAQPGADILPRLQQEFEANGHDPIKVTLRLPPRNWDEGAQLHSVAVLGIENGQVSLWDPATGDISSMSAREFNSQVARVTVTKLNPQTEGPQLLQRWWGNSEDYYDEREGGGKVGSSGGRG